VQVPGSHFAVIAACAELARLLGPVPQLWSITVAVPPGQVTDMAFVVGSTAIVPTVVPEPSLNTIVIGGARIPVTTIE
jgi:hypothetical protein